MQTIKLTILGSFYDSQIYSGRLHLWTNYGSIITVDWERLVDSLIVQERLDLALTCAFKRSDYFYGNHWELVFRDSEIRHVIQTKFQDLAQEDLSISKNVLKRFIVEEVDNKIPFPHADTEIYSNMLYVGDQSGLTATECFDGRISPWPNRIWDGPALSIRASYSTLALSAGSEGLYQYSLQHQYQDKSKPTQLLNDHSIMARWLFSSIFSSSYYNEGFLAEFVKSDDTAGTEKSVPRSRSEEIAPRRNFVDVFFDDESATSRLVQERQLREVIPSSGIFGHETKNGRSTFVWGAHDKVCLARSGTFEIVKFRGNQKDPNRRFENLGTITVPLGLEGDIVGADSALFGYIVEGEEGLLVIDSMLNNYWLEGEPVNWRVFPRSTYYLNQLHAIYEDRLCVYSFNDDYFASQKEKQVGIQLSALSRARRK